MENHCPMQTPRIPYLSIHPFINLAIRSSIYPFIYLIYLSIYLSIHRSIHPSIHPYIYNYYCTIVCLRLILRHMPPRIQALCSPTGATGACFTPFLRHNGGTMQLFPAARLVGHQSLSLGQSLSLCITFIQFQNHLVGIYMVYTWYIHGIYMVYTWYIHGIYMVYIKVLHLNHCQKHHYGGMNITKPRLWSRDTSCHIRTSSHRPVIAWSA